MIDDVPKKYHPVIQLIDEVIRINSRLRTLFEGTAASTGLPTMAFTVLVAVVESKSPPTVPQIGRSLGHARQVIQRAANLLVDDGLIEALPNPNHKRAPLLIATETGRKLKHNADVRALVAADALLEDVDGAKCEHLTGELRDLRHGLEAHIKTRNLSDGT